MPYERHSDLRDPEDLNTRIWRFTDLPKFLDLIQSSKLYFCRGDCFDDPYEGLLTDGYVAFIKSGRTNIPSVPDANRTLMETRVSYYVNSWHLSEHEPAGMWKLYAGADAGIAICSTYSRLQHAFDEDKDHRYFLGVVQYDERALAGSFNSFKFMMNKRASFRHEDEARALIWELPPVPVPDDQRPKGLKVPVNLHTLITNVVVSPTAPRWFLEVLIDVVRKYGYAFRVASSELYVNKYLPVETI